MIASRVITPDFLDLTPASGFLKMHRFLRIRRNLHLSCVFRNESAWKLLCDSRSSDCCEWFYVLVGDVVLHECKCITDVQKKQDII